jgi:murein DD-endopeptidase MepM/ murein hydrolase activator NlpD
MRNIALPLLAGVGFLAAFNVMQPRDSKAVTDRTTAPLLETIQVAPVEQTATHVMQRGETLSGVLTQLSVVGQDLADVLLVLREHQNPRRMTEGAEISVHRWTSTGAPRSLELRLNADSTVILAKTAMGWDGQLALTPVVVDTVYVSGKIDAGRTLYESLVLDETINLRVDERVQLAYNLGAIYAYTIDFSREIQPGDSYQMAYEREARPDGTARSRRILISEVVNQGKHLNAVFFKHGSVEGYYSKDGKSLRMGFRRSPLEFTRVTSSFSWQRYHPILGIYRAHLGTDYGAAPGTPVYAVAEGTVATASFDRGYGNNVLIRHVGGYSTRYAHLRGFAKSVHVGRHVKQNDVIGYVGQTGLATGPHLHFELRLSGHPVDSRKVKLPGAPPIPHEYRGEFKQLVEERLALLEQAVTSPRLAKN